MWTMYAIHKTSKYVKGHGQSRGSYEPSPIHIWAKAQYEQMLKNLEAKAEARKTKVTK